MQKVVLLVLLLLGSISIANAAGVFAGPYTGIHVGYVDGDDKSVEYSGGSPTGWTYESELVGWLLGGYAGYNYNFNNNLLVGLEGEIEGRFDADDRNFGKENGITNTDRWYQAETNYGASIRGRLGYLINDITLVFVTGGYAGIEIDREWFEYSRDETAKDTTWHHGWTAGGGIEHKIFNIFAIKFEYRYSDYDSENINDPNFNLLYNADYQKVEYDEHSVRAGITYLFP